MHFVWMQHIMGMLQGLSIIGNRCFSISNPLRSVVYLYVCIMDIILRYIYFCCMPTSWYHGFLMYSDTFMVIGMTK